MRVLKTKLGVEIENETKVFLESLEFEIKMRVLQKSAILNICHRHPLALLNSDLQKLSSRKSEVKFCKDMEFKVEILDYFYSVVERGIVIRFILQDHVTFSSRPQIIIEF